MGLLRSGANDLSFQQLGGLGAMAVGEELQRRSPAAALDLTANNIQADGAAVLARALRANSTLVARRERHRQSHIGEVQA